MLHFKACVGVSRENLGDSGAGSDSLHPTRRGARLDQGDQINPLLATPDQILALDARVMLHDSSLAPEHLPRAAIRPYPSQYVWEWKLKDGTPVTIRPIRPEDEPLIVQFHHTLSERSVYLRYFCSLSLTTRVDHERLVRICFPLSFSMNWT